ncbi:MAG: MBL fold metallo-hydrolase [Chloroflexi bacterium]|nr:MBL fold metallo-hydrolase [Chloroflexota bacterium]
MSAITITFWGVRGSYPAPGVQTARVGGNTPCVEICAGNHTIILDAGTGIIALGNAMVAQQRADQKPITATLLISHTHHDHTQGFPFFTPTHYQTTTLHVFGPKTLHQDLQDVLARAMLPPVFPITLDELPCVRFMRNLQEGESILLNSTSNEPRVFQDARDQLPLTDDVVRIRALRSHAHPQGVFIYCIEYRGKSVVYATDTEGYTGGDQRLINFTRGTSLLIHDAQYLEDEYASITSPRQGWGHSTWQMAVAVARAADAQRLALFHHEPTHDDDRLERLERDAQAAFPNTFLAREGMTIEL